MKTNNLTFKIAAGIVIGWIAITVIGTIANELYMASQNNGGMAKEAADEMERINAEVDRKRAEIREERKKMCAEGDTYWCGRY